MSSLLVVGAGSFATEVEEIANLCGYSETAFLDDNLDNTRCKPVLGCLNDLVRIGRQYDSVVIAFGNNEMRMKYFIRAEKAGFNLPALIHPTAYVSPEARIEAGCIVRTGAVISRYVHLGKAVIVNIGAMIDHDCCVGDGSHLLIGSVIRNKATVPPLSWVEANRVIE